MVDPQRDIDRVLDLAARDGVRITHVFETHIHNDYVTGGLALAARDRCRVPRQRRRPGRLRAGPGARRRRHRGRRPRCGCGCSPPPATPSPTCPTRWTGDGEPVGGVHRRLAAVRLHRPARPARPGHTHDLVHHQYASAHRLAAELPDETPRCCPPTGSAASARPPSPRPPPPRSARRSGTNPVLTRDEETLRRRAARRAGRLPGLLRAHGPGQQPPARRAPDLSPPDAGRRRRAAPADRGRASGWSTCAPAPPSPPGTCPAR